MTSHLAALSAAHDGMRLEVLGRLAYGAEEVGPALRGLIDAPGVLEAAILSTCNRTEIYALLDGEGHSTLEDFLIADRRLERELPPGIRRLDGRRAVATHLFRVSAGLESMVVGEEEIQGQIRRAHRAALEAGSAHSELDALFRAAIQAGRRVRRETVFGTSRRSLGRTAVEQLAGGTPGGLSGRTVLVVGAGKIAGVVVGDLRGRGATVLICSRTEERARRLASGECAVLPLAGAVEALRSVDAAICCTSAPHLMITAGDVDGVLRHRDRGTLVLIDLSVPRDIDPDVRHLHGVRLIDLEDLGEAGLQDAKRLGEAVAVVQRLIEAELNRYLAWAEGRRAGAVVARLRERAERVCRAELDRAWRRNGHIDQEAAASAVHVSLARLFHGLSDQARDASAAGDDTFLARLSRIIE